MSSSGLRRGAFIVFEGCDKAGKTTQCRKLVEKLGELGVPVQLMQFPDRSTATGRIINNYLAKTVDLPDQAVHLLFSANRWESQPKMKQLLEEGVTLIVDRYSFSGVAYSAAKPGMGWDWCYKPEIGLPKPDLVFFLHVPQESSCSRGGFGEERYENKEFQQHVYNNYMRLKDETWKVMDASKSIDQVHEDLMKHTKDIIENVKSSQVEVFK